MNTVIKSKQLFCIFIALYPILNRYQAPVPFLTLAESLFLLFFLSNAVLRFRKTVTLKTELLPFCLYLFCYVFFVFAFESGEAANDTIGTGLRLLYIYVMLSVLVNQNFDIEYGCICIRKTAIFLSGYAILQFICYYAGILLTSYIPLLPVMGENMDVTRYRQYMTYGISFRPCSLLNEPAHLATYLLLSLALVLFSEKKSRNWVWEAVLLTVTCFLSKSSTGIMVSIVVWFYFWIQTKNMSLRKLSKRLFIGIIGTTAIAAFLHYSGILSYFVNRTFGGSLSVSGLLSSTRFGDLETMFQSSNTLAGILFGAGLSETENYLPGWARLYYTLGLVGLVLVILQVRRMYKKGLPLQRNVTILYSLLNIGTEILFGNFAVPFLCIIMADKIGGRYRNAHKEYKTTS